MYLIPKLIDRITPALVYSGTEIISRMNIDNPNWSMPMKMNLQLRFMYMYICITNRHKS